MHDSKIVTVALEGLENILKVGQLSCGPDGANPMVNLVAECGGIVKIEELQSHENHAIYQRAVKLLETYFGAVDEEDTAIAPEIVDGDVMGGQYGFGTGSAGLDGGGFPANTFRFG